MLGGCVRFSMTSPSHQEWQNAIAVNVIGTVVLQRGEDGVDYIPPLQTFQTSVEPLSTDHFFKRRAWQKIYKFTQAGPVACCLTCLLQPAGGTDLGTCNGDVRRCGSA